LVAIFDDGLNQWLWYYRLLWFDISYTYIFWYYII